MICRKGYMAGCNAFSVTEGMCKHLFPVNCFDATMNIWKVNLCLMLVKIER